MVPACGKCPVFQTPSPVPSIQLLTACPARGYVHSRARAFWRPTRLPGVASNTGEGTGTPHKLPPFPRGCWLIGLRWHELKCQHRARKTSTLTSPPLFRYLHFPS